jgi:hypothetical protein
MNREYRDRVEASAALLGQARRLLSKAHLWLLLLGDATSAYTIHHIILDMDTERRRWRRVAGLLR